MSSDEDEERGEGNEVVDTDAADASDAGGEAPPPRDESVEVRSSEARRKLREQLEAEMEAFLKRGGRIEVVEAANNAQGTSFTAGVNDLSQ
jgi:hypothetical protein